MDNLLSQRTKQRKRAARKRPLAFVLPLLAAACASGAPPAPDTAQGNPPAVAASAATEEIVLAGTTDIHGYVIPHDYYTNRRIANGLALIKPLVDSLRAAHPGSVYLFDSGDLIQGNPFALVHSPMGPDRGEIVRKEGNPIIRAMNLLRYDVEAVGNHEYNYGLEHLRAAVEQSKAPFVSANIFDAKTGQHAYEPYVLLPHVTAAGDTILIGVTGNTPPGVAVWDKQNVQGILEFRDVVASLKPVVAEMRDKGADVVVVLSHGGLEGTSYDTIATGLPPENASARVAREIPGVDVIFLGHTHREVADTTINGVLLTQPKNWATNLAVATLELRREAPGRWSIASKHSQILRPDPARADQAFLDSLRLPHERTIAFVGSVIGQSTARMEARRSRVEDTPILDFINEVQRKAAGTDLSAAAAFELGSVIPKGPVTVADIAGLYVYDNTLKAVRITGEQLKAYLEQSARYFTGWPANGGPLTDPKVPGYNFDVVSGVEYTIDLRRPAGDRITGLTFKGKPVRADQSFTMAVNNYRQNGGGGFSMVAGAPVVYDRQENIRDLLIEEVRRQRTIRPEDYFRKNWTLLPTEAAQAIAGDASREPTRAAAPSSGAKRLRVLTTNDFHGRLQPEKPSWARGREIGGAASLAAHFDRERRGFGGPTMLVDGGDVMQGTPISNLTKGRSVIEYYNVARYAAAALGNHDFDWGTDVLRERLKQATFPWMAANVFVAGSDTAPSWVRQTAMVDVDGVKVGVIGIATELTPEVTVPSRIKGLTFASEPAAIDRWVPELRRRGADFVIVVAHSGATCDRDGHKCRGEIIDVAAKVRNRPDLIVAGHTHAVVADRVNGITIVEAGSYGTRYGVVDLERVSTDSVAVNIRDIPTAYVDAMRPDSAVAALVERYRKQIGPKVERVVARLAQPLDRDGREYPLGRLIADAQRAAAGTQVAFVNNGGIRAAIDAGPVTWGELQTIQPFENLVVRLRVTGAQLREITERYLEDGGPDAQVSGMEIRYDPARPKGSRIVEMKLSSGETVRDAGTYTLAVNNFMADQLEKDGQMIVSRENTEAVDLDVLVAYLEKQPQPVRAPETPRWVPVRGVSGAN